jgi:protein-disulfide isomerase
MRRTISLSVAVVALATGILLTLTSAPAAESADGRKARILANLQVEIPQLAEMNVVMGEIKPSRFQGLDEGTFSVPGRGEQNFLVSHDDKEFWMVGAPLNVSRSSEEIAAMVAEKEAQKQRDAMAKQKQLDAAIEGVPVRGNPDAPVTIVEFSDFQCPYCARGATTVDELLKKYPNDVKVVFKHFPLGFHNWAKPAAIAANCAAKQKDEAFWALHDQFFANQKDINAGNVMAKSRAFLDSIGIDLTAWGSCAEKTDGAEYTAAAAAVEADMALGQSLGVTGTPGFFVNGTFLNGAQPITAFEPLIAKAKSGS